MSAERTMTDRDIMAHFEFVRDRIRSLEARAEAKACAGVPRKSECAECPLKRQPSPHNRKIRVAIEATARRCGVDQAVIRAYGKRREFVRARHIAMYVAKMTCRASLQAIGWDFGGFHHTTVHYGIKKIQRGIERDAALRATVEEIITEVTS